MRREPNKSFRPFARWLTVVLAAATAGPLAVPSAPASAQELKQGGALRAALTGEPDTLDPATSSIYTGAQVYENIFSKLVDLDASGKFVPDLALSWTQVDPPAWKFTLANNAVFHRR